MVAWTTRVNGVARDSRRLEYMPAPAVDQFRFAARAAITMGIDEGSTAPVEGGGGVGVPDGVGVPGGSGDP